MGDNTILKIKTAKKENIFDRFDKRSPVYLPTDEQVQN